MNDQSRQLIHAIRGPVILITIGVLFAAEKMTDYHFGQTWPVLLIVIGLLQLIGGRRQKADYYPPPNSPGSPSSVPPPPSAQPASHEDTGAPQA